MQDDGFMPIKKRMSGKELSPRENHHMVNKLLIGFCGESSVARFGEAVS
jgi:hypothetical protein